MQYKNINDYEMIYYVRENDENATQILYKKYLPVLKSICLKYYKKFKYLGIDFDDLSQEASISFFSALKDYNDDGSLLYSYIILCVEREIISYCKKVNNLKNYPLNFSLGDEFLSEKSKFIIDQNDFEDILIENERFFEIKNILDFILSTIFELRYNDFSYKEISILLDIPKSTVDGRLSKIRKLIKNNLNFEL